MKLESRLSRKSSYSWTCAQSSHRNDRVTELWAHEYFFNRIWVTKQSFIVNVKDGNYGIITFIFAKYFVLRRHRIANFANIIKVSIIFNQETFKESIKAKGIENFVLKCNLYLYFTV